VGRFLFDIFVYRSRKCNRTALRFKVDFLEATGPWNNEQKGAREQESKKSEDVKSGG
jgi:hypothetical protein